MTRDALLARRAELLPLYQNSDGDLRDEIRVELDSIRDRLRDMPPEPRPTPKKAAGRRKWTPRRRNNWIDRSLGMD